MLARLWLAIGAGRLTVMPWPKGVPRSQSSKAAIARTMTGRRFPHGRDYGSGLCAICDGSFARHNATHKYCSDECLAIARQAWHSGISAEAYGLLLKRQRGRCAICGSKQHHGPANHERFYVDHCHKRNVVRGLLCLRCNTGLGHFDDNPKQLKRALAYLERPLSDALVLTRGKRRHVPRRLSS